MKTFLTVPILAVLLLFAGCAHRTKAAGSPVIPVTPMEQVAATNADIATINHMIEQGIVRLNAAGVIKDDAAKGQLTLSYKIADSDKQITKVLQSSDPSASKGTQISAILEQLKTAASTLVQDGSLNVKNPASQETVSVDIQAVLTLANSMVQTLQAGGVIQ